jgi:hypothetical protein
MFNQTFVYSGFVQTQLYIQQKNLVTLNYVKYIFYNKIGYTFTVFYKKVS